MIQSYIRGPAKYSAYENSQNSGLSVDNFQYLCGSIGSLHMRGKDLKGVRVHEISK